MKYNSKQKNYVLYSINRYDGFPVYIGITNNINDRMRTHKYRIKKNYNHPLYDEIRKMNKDENYKLFYIILKNNLTRKQALEEEKKEISYLNSGHSRLYNQTVGGGGTLGYKHTQATIDGIKRNQTILYGKNNPFYGKHHSEETKNILSKKCKNYGTDNGFYGKKHSKRFNNSQRIRTILRNSIPIEQYDMNNNLIKEWKSKKEFSQDTGISNKTLIKHNFIYNGCKYKTLYMDRDTKQYWQSDNLNKLYPNVKGRR